jgi:hypothetical protein
MRRRGALFWAVIAAAVAILAYQVFIPPVIGLSDQGDFRRMIGRFGHGPEHADGRLNLAFVEPKYIPDTKFRAPEWEQFSSEYFFVSAALLVNKLISKDGKLDITVIGLIHVVAFLAIFARFLAVTQPIPARRFVWLAALVILTDAGYAAYWNSFYAEPASFLFCFAVLTESIEMCCRGKVLQAGLARWLLWAALFVLAKPQNAPLGLLLALFTLRLSSWAADRPVKYAAYISSAVIACVAAAALLGVPVELKNANTYNLVFKAILPESRNPAADLQALGMNTQLKDRSRTGAWSPDTAFPELEATGVIGGTVTLATVMRFYLFRPTRLWRHIQAMLPIALSLRPEHCGNFEPSAGHGPGDRTTAFTLWSSLRERALGRVVKFILFLLPAFVLITLVWTTRKHHLAVEFLALLALCCFTAFLTAVFGDAWDNVRHLFLFNLLLDACLVSAAASAWSRAYCIIAPVDCKYLNGDQRKQCGAGLDHREESC